MEKKYKSYKKLITPNELQLKYANAETLQKSILTWKALRHKRQAVYTLFSLSQNNLSIYYV